MAYNGVIFAAPLGSINVSAQASLLALNPLLAQIDFALFGSLGLGALQANFQAQLSAALQASFDIGLNISNPFLGFQIALAGIAALQAQIALALSGAIPTISVEATGQISAMASLAAALAIQIGGLEALIQGSLAVKLPAVSFAAQLAASLSAGPVFLLSFEDVMLSSAGSSISGSFTGGLSYGPYSIAPTEVCSGIILVTKSPTAWAAMKATLATGT